MLDSGDPPSRAASKQAWRTWLRRRRAALSPAERADAGAALTALAASLDLGEVAAYVPVGSEPALRLHRPVLLPVTPAEPGPLDWAWSGDLAPGPFGLLEPVGPRLGQDALAGVDTVLLPALGVARDGVRMGRGAGYYDRSLRPGPRLIAVVYDHELVDHLPSEPTDVPVHGALTPSGLVEF
ncbi:5-formyltetrahydrofolate cyclo-ligase [Tsukamurella pulmonis]|uniref:5-formyltetrahydrofolate cyclo-ligase n=1 Tax=Tsukamurella pulmonis TaxID=47312 RepID=A0A1H1H679_9ACTN|nr:5-formyltetrahydrofolate cyclo-ligase [Tsukamurella pulmonis]KXO95085.1 5-formyltetrahydrofolate cyclo-ligase [Tsukamurella pulmonis]KXP13660.1 5-formyltetrahydrofolate cyclo-ligase [Tsukamurella pulmonis]RDH09995.1 5-formyltetrahydrofolate cyclo-ligase [Tsukamurella pulmonis]SDR20992.1 5-formyltetrahydrofolate cyclo-ligase [Tsukamurella pulmonis]SUP15818.1 5-formyltetrahydrofolate cyclo-ligase family protein [Tsukamurella pulmonis]